VVFVAHRPTRQGVERSRRLFSTLNRYAKPVTLGEIIVLDEDDALAITTRELLERHAFLSEPGIVVVTKTKTVPRSSRTCWTTIQCIYEALDILHFPKDTKQRQRSLFKQHRPDDDKLRNCYDSARSFFDILIEFFPPLAELAGRPPADCVAGNYRHAEGGHLLFRPVGLLAVSRATRKAIDMGMSTKTIVGKIARMPMELSQRPWVGLLWDHTTKRIITNKKNQEVASLLMLRMAGIDWRQVAPRGYNLRREYAGLLNQPLTAVRLPPRIP